MADEKASDKVPTGIQRHSRHLSDPRILFPVIAAVLIITAWTTAGLLIRADYRLAREAAAKSTVDLAQTYEAQVVRALREIEQTLGFIKYSYANGRGAEVLNEMNARDLLPSTLLFTTSITNSEGDIVATTGDETGNIADKHWFYTQRDSGEFAVDVSRQNTETGEWLAHFSLRLETGDRGFAGVASIAVDPSYFVSSYEPEVMGEHGVLGVLRNDGTFLVRRTGEEVTYGEQVDHATVMQAGDGFDAVAQVVVNPWDGVPRYSVARELFGFPLVIVAGLSEQEKLQPAKAALSGHVWRASAATLLALLITGLLGRLSWQLQKSRQRAMDEEVAHAKQIEYIAYHDSLTGLANRSLFSKLLSLSIAQSRRYERQLAVLFLDLDRFKLINDTLGHDAGDDLLIQLAERLKYSLRASDTVARLGGDEFVVLLPETAEEKQLSIVAQKILAAVRKPFLLANQELRITVSIGISIYPTDGEDEQTLMKNADIAMYNAKSEGKNGFKFYSAALNTNSLERLSLESSLRRALDQDEFRLFYQARKSIDGNRITGVEALLRWQHPDLGMTLPMKFLPLAEESGLIVQIGHWVLETACRQAVAWREQGFDPLIMSVNLSAREFSDENLLRSVTEILDKTGMDPSQLEIEFAENLLTSNLDTAAPIVSGLTKLGVHIAIDNFGTGYASLSALKQFHVNTIKVDHRFIRDIVENLEDQHLIEAIITMAKALGLTVVAEGVETREQAEILGSKSCDEIQGYYFNRPSPPEELTVLLSAARKASEN